MYVQFHRIESFLYMWWTENLSTISLSKQFHYLKSVSIEIIDEIITINALSSSVKSSHDEIEMNGTRNWEMKESWKRRTKQKEWTKREKRAHCMPISNVLNSHDIRAHAETLKMHVYLSIHRNDDVSFATSVRHILMNRINPVRINQWMKCWWWMFFFIFLRRNELEFCDFVLKLLFIWHLAYKWN